MYVLVSRIKRKSWVQSIIVSTLTKVIRHQRLQGLVSLDVHKMDRRIWIREVWQEKSDMLRFRKSSHHMRIIQKLNWLFVERETIQFESNEIPDWDEVKRRMAPLLDMTPSKKRSIRKRVFRMAAFMMPLMVLFMLFVVPSPIDPEDWKPEPMSTGAAYEPNHLLAQSEMLAEGKLSQPEDLLVDQDGKIYTGTQDGKIYRIELSNERGMEHIEMFAETGGYPLGLQMDDEGRIIAAVKGKGLMAVRQDGSVELLTKEVEDTPITYANGLAIAKDGSIYFTDSSTRFDRGWPYDILEGRPHGRLLSFNPDSKETSIVLSNLYFPNGLVLSSNEDYLLIAETPRYRILRYWISGPHSGKLESYAENLPNMPDNLFTDEEGDLWVGGSKRIKNIDFLQSRPFLKKQVAKLPVAMLNKVPDLNRYGLVVRLSPDGKLKQTLHDPGGNVYGISSVVRIGDTLYLGTLFGNSVGRYELKR